MAAERDVRDQTILGRNQNSFAWYDDNSPRSGAKKRMIWGMTDKTHRRVLAYKKHGRSNKSEATAREEKRTCNQVYQEIAVCQRQ